MFLQLIYLHSATGELICVFYMYYLKSPHLFACRFTIFLYCEFENFRLPNVRKDERWFLFPKYDSTCHGQPVARYFLFSIMEWKQQIVHHFRSTSGFYMLNLRMSELWWTSLECEAGNDVVHYETIQQHSVFCYELQYEIVKKCVW
jgi:hypothetical protein